jgi:hypothetical protein
VTSFTDVSSAPHAASAERARRRSWVPAIIYGAYIAVAFGLTWRFWAHPTTAIVASKPPDTDQFAWFLRYEAAAVSHGRLPSLVTTAMNMPHGINMMWNTTVLLPGVLLTPITMLAGAQVSLTLLLTAGFAGSAASMFYVLRRYRASLPAAAIGGAVYGFSPALTHAVLGHYQLEFAVLPPLIVDAAVRVCLATSRRTLAWSAAWLGLLIAAQLFIGEEILFEAVVAAFLIVVVLALSRPRAALAVAGRTAVGLGVAAAVTLVVASWGLWEQFFGRLTQHGSPFRPDFYKNSLSAFVTPAPSQLIHFAQSQAQRAGEGSEYVAYLGWPLIIVLVIATVVLWRHLTVRVCGVTTALLLLLSIGAHPKLTPFDRSAKITLPWRLLEHLPLVGSLLPSRLSIVADGTAAALLAFAIDLTWRRLAGAPADPASAPASENGPAGDSPRRSGIGPAGDSPRRSGIGRRWAGVVVGIVTVIAVLPLVPVPLNAYRALPLPSGWNATFAALRLPKGATVLVVPVPTGKLTDTLRWQAESWQQISLVGGYYEGPDKHGHVGIDAQTLQLQPYLNELWGGSGGIPPVSIGQAKATVRYWRPAAVVAVAPRPMLLAYLDHVFGPPTVRFGSTLGWRLRPGVYVTSE